MLLIKHISIKVYTNGDFMDRRIKYTKRMIKETFLSLLEKKDINKITVSEICTIADINRATFYRYYLDIYDLFDKIQEDFVEKLKIYISTVDDNFTIFSFSRGLLEVLLEEKELAKIIFNINNNLIFLNDILEIAYNNCYNNWKKDLPNTSDEDIGYAAIFIFNGALGIINFWIKNNFDKDIDEIALLIQNLSYSGIKKFIYNKQS